MYPASIGLRPRSLSRSIRCAVVGAAISLTQASAVCGAEPEPITRPAKLQQTTSTVLVKNCNDAGAGSLRDAFAHAVDGEQIDLTQLSCSKITLTTGSLSDSGAANVSILGKGQTVDGSNKDRVFFHTGSGALTIYDLKITHGKGATGGCIFSAGGVNLVGSVVTECTAAATGYGSAYGGAIMAQGAVLLADESEVSASSARSDSGLVKGGGVWATAVTIIGSSVISNYAMRNAKEFSVGGGIFVSRATTSPRFLLGASAATIDNNSADSGGGVFADSVQIYKSTISSNSGTYYGGGILMPARTNAYSRLVETTISSNRTTYLGGAMFIGRGDDVRMEQCTVTANYSSKTAEFIGSSGLQSAGFVSGIYTIGKNLSLKGTLIAANTGSDRAHGDDIISSCPQKVCATPITGANNLVSQVDVFMPADTITTPEPMLGPLAYNGGPTRTHALLPGSPAIDAGALAQAVVYPNDQRGPGYPRAIGPRQDIGSFELDTDTIFKNDFE